MAQGHPPAAAMASYRRSRLPFARPQTLQTSAQLGREKVPQQAQHAPRPQAKATARPQQWLKGTPRPQQWLLIGVQGCRLPGLKRSKSPPSSAGKRYPNKPNTRHARAQKLTQAVSIVLRSCYLARFGHPLKPSKPPQLLSKALEPQNPPQQLSKASRLLCHGTSLGPASCFYCASKLLRGTFWAPLKTFKTPAAAFEGLRISKPSAAAFQGAPPALPWYLPRPHKLFLLGFETATWHVLGTP